MNQQDKNSRRIFLKAASIGTIFGANSIVYADEQSNQNSTFNSNLKVFNHADGQVNPTAGVVSKNSRSILESQREIPVTDQNQVLVCGGGPAGIAAALASARAGADTRLLEYNGCLGGVWTAGLLTKILDAENKSGIMEEILNIMKQRGSSVAKNTKGTTYDPELMKLVLEELLVEAGVKIQLKTQVVGAIRDQQNRLRAVLTESKSGREAWLADRFIDCTGDGDLAAQAGCQFDVGCDKDCSCQPMSMLALLTGPDPESVGDYIRELGGSSAKFRLLEVMKSAGIDPSYHAPTLRHLHSGLFSIMTNHEYGVPAFDANAITQATISARAEIHEIVNKLRKTGGIWSDLAVVATAEQIGVREGRRIKGRYEITVDDLFTGVRHADAITRARFPVDVHSVKITDGKSYHGAPKGKKVKSYDIPLRSLIAADIDSLMMAGRCISGDFFAHASYRVTGNSVPMGEAAGRASAISVSKGVMPHELSIADLKMTS